MSDFLSSQAYEKRLKGEEQEEFEGEMSHRAKVAHFLAQVHFLYY